MGTRHESVGIHRGLWVGTGILVVGTLITELLPLFLGVGRRAVRDWSFAYVTLHFILLPGLAAALIGMAVSFVLSSVRNQEKPFNAAVLAALLSATYLIALALDPLLWLRGVIK